MYIRLISLARHGQPIQQILYQMDNDRLCHWKPCNKYAAIVFTYVYDKVPSMIKTMLHGNTKHVALGYNVHILCLYYFTRYVVIPPATKLRGGIMDTPFSSVRLSVRLSAVDVQMITRILFIGFQFLFWYRYHLDQDLGWDWIWGSYLIRYAHNGW